MGDTSQLRRALPRGSDRGWEAPKELWSSLSRERIVGERFGQTHDSLIETMVFVILHYPRPLIQLLQIFQRELGGMYIKVRQSENLACGLVKLVQRHAPASRF